MKMVLITSGSYSDYGVCYLMETPDDLDASSVVKEYERKHEAIMKDVWEKHPYEDMEINDRSRPENRLRYAADQMKKELAVEVEHPQDFDKVLKELLIKKHRCRLVQYTEVNIPY